VVGRSELSGEWNSWRANLNEIPSFVNLVEFIDRVTLEVPLPREEALRLHVTLAPHALKDLLLLNCLPMTELDAQREAAEFCG